MKGKEMVEVTTRNLIDEAKAKLVVKAKASKSSTKQVEALDPVLMNELLAKRSELYDAVKSLKAEQDAIDAIIKDAIGSADELTVNGAKVASIARWRETSLVTDKVKELFPITECPEIYKATAKSRLTVH